MTREEHKSIIEFVEAAVRVDNDEPAARFDVEADAIIRALFVRKPDAAYRITMLAMAQQKELAQLLAERREAKAKFRSGWLAWLLNKRGRQRYRRDPRMSAVQQNIRIR